MQKLKMHSPDMTQEHIARIRELFPNCVTEARGKDGSLRLSVDFDLLRQELSDSIVEGPQERYHLDWPGKREAMLAANAPIAKALRPCREESVDFDTTKNLFIEGDNLDALKLLQETYLGKVKMIYIDPPYNRKKGNDLIYRDDFVGNSYEYLKSTNQIDSISNERLIANTDSNGRFHSDWLSMIYQRLRVAKNFLSDDGVIVISIEDSETANLLLICNEIFGESNFVGTIIWNNATDNNPTNIAIEHESIHVYAKNKSLLEGCWKSKVSKTKDILISIGNTLNEKYKGNINELKKAYTKWYKEHKNELYNMDRYKYIDAGGVYTGSQSVHNPGKDGYRYSIIHPITGKPCKQPLMGYRFPKETMERLISENKLIELKVYAAEYMDKLSSIFDLDGRVGAYDLKILFPEIKKLFSNPKPVQLLSRLLSFMTTDNCLCLDFFAGSSTTAHAVMQLNAEDGGNRRFIMVQLPEACGATSEAAKAGYGTIAEISKERIRRAGKKILEGDCHEGWNRDVGFRVLKVDTSNMADVFYTPDALQQNLLDLTTDNIKPSRTPEDLLFQVLLDWGVELTLPIRKESIQGKTVFFVDDNALVACFDRGIDEALVRELAACAPLRVVFRDNGFVSDAVKINVEQIFRQLSPGTEVRCL